MHVISGTVRYSFEEASEAPRVLYKLIGAATSRQTEMFVPPFRVFFRSQLK